MKAEDLNLHKEEEFDKLMANLAKHYPEDLVHVKAIPREIVFKLFSQGFSVGYTFLLHAIEDEGIAQRVQIQ